jgi:hypothetical protein
VRLWAGPCKLNASQAWATHASLVSQTDKQLGKWGAGLGDLAAADPGAKRRGSATQHLKPDKKHGVLKKRACNKVASQVHCFMRRMPLCV